MRSKISKKILSETSQETKDKVNEYANKLVLSGVSQQRELLIAFANYIELNNNKLGGKKTLDLVDYFIAINCG